MKSNPELLDRCWSWLSMALVGEQIDEKDEICGAGTFQLLGSLFSFSMTLRSFLSPAVVSVRHKIDRIQVWTRSKDNVDLLNSIGKKLYKLLDLSNEPSIGLEFQVCHSLSGVDKRMSLKELTLYTLSSTLTTDPVETNLSTLCLALVEALKVPDSFLQRVKASVVDGVGQEEPLDRSGGWALLVD